MGRAPINQAAPGRDDIWIAIRKQGDAAFSVADITASSGANAKSIRDYCKGLTAAAYLEQQPEVPGDVSRWKLVRDIGHEAPRVRPDGSPVTQGSVNEQMWRGMTMLREFSYEDLIETATITITVDAAKSYCRMLLATGYLRVVKKADPVKGRIARYRLIRNNGPKPPQVQRVKQVFDPNSREVFTPEGGA